MKKTFKWRTRLNGSVGRKGANSPSDVWIVQLLINSSLPSGAKPLVVDGLSGAKTIGAIEEFQSRVLRFRKPDGLVDPKGHTFNSLLNNVSDRSTQSGPRKHLIIVTRKWSSAASTGSTFQIYDAITDEISSGYFLEREGPDTLEPGKKKRIVEGLFNLTWAWHTDTGGIEEHLPLPCLYNGQVSHTRGIYIHNGNKPDHTYGCLLIGRTREPDRVWHSVNGLNALKRYLGRVGIETVKVRILADYGEGP